MSHNRLRHLDFFPFDMSCLSNRKNRLFKKKFFLVISVFFPIQVVLISLDVKLRLTSNFLLVYLFIPLAKLLKATLPVYLDLTLLSVCFFLV